MKSDSQSKLHPSSRLAMLRWSLTALLLFLIAPADTGSPLYSYMEGRTCRDLNRPQDLDAVSPPPLSVQKDLCGDRRPVAWVRWIKEDGPMHTKEDHYPSSESRRAECSELALRSRRVYPGSAQGDGLGFDGPGWRTDLRPLKQGMILCDGDSVITWAGVRVSIMTLFQAGQKEGDTKESVQLWGMSRATFFWDGQQLVEGRMDIYGDPDNPRFQLALGSRAPNGGPPPVLAAHRSVATAWVGDACWSEGAVAVEPGDQHWFDLKRSEDEGVSSILRVDGGDVRSIWEESEAAPMLPIEEQESAQEAAAKGWRDVRAAQEEAVETRGKTTRVDWAPPPTGTLRMKVSPRKATVWIDGRPAPKQGRRLELETLAGWRAVEVRAPGYQTRSVKVQVIAGGETDWKEVRLEAKPKPKEASPSGKAGALPAPLPDDDAAKRRAEIGLKLVAIPGGTFTMGSPEGDKEADPDEHPAHEVTVPGFWMGQTEVTNAQYQACVDDGACTEPPSWDNCIVNWDKEKDEPIYGEANEALKAPQNPVLCVDWTQAKAFATWVGGRLPTEAEWEYAARGSEGRRYAWGDKLPGEKGPKRGNFRDESMKTRFTGEDFVDGYDDGYIWTSPVGSFPDGRTPEGLDDMTGNAFEWCEDVNYSSYNGAPKDGSAWVSGGDTSIRVVRGGSWFINARGLRAANRDRSRADDRYSIVGFRVALSSPPAVDP